MTTDMRERRAWVWKAKDKYGCYDRYIVTFQDEDVAVFIIDECRDAHGAALDEARRINGVICL